MLTRFLKYILRKHEARPPFVWQFKFAAITAFAFVVAEVATAYFVLGVALWVSDLLGYTIFAWIIQLILIGLWLESQLDEIFGRLGVLP